MQSELSRLKKKSMPMTTKTTSARFSFAHNIFSKKSGRKHDPFEESSPSTNEEELKEVSPPSEDEDSEYFVERKVDPWQNVHISRFEASPDVTFSSPRHFKEVIDDIIG